ncbi:hypothetical protein ZWY2020_021333 [Hordeum vulgare]|nr:hypothetical protein ZWY2020_021333 [Hordeum vulgare]
MSVKPPGKEGRRSAYFHGGRIGGRAASVHAAPPPRAPPPPSLDRLTGMTGLLVGLGLRRRALAGSADRRLFVSATPAPTSRTTWQRVRYGGARPARQDRISSCWLEHGGSSSCCRASGDGSDDLQIFKLNRPNHRDVEINFLCFVNVAAVRCELTAGAL